jgi:hypothetical protein
MAEKTKLREPPELHKHCEQFGVWGIMVLGLVSIITVPVALGTAIIMGEAIFRNTLTPTGGWRAKEAFPVPFALVLAEICLGLLAGITAWATGRAMGRYYGVSTNAPVRLKVGYKLGRIGTVACAVALIVWIFVGICLILVIALAAILKGMFLAAGRR